MKNCSSGNSRISPYTKSFLEGTDDDVSGTDAAGSFVAKEPPQPESVDKKPQQLAGTKTSSNDSDVMAADNSQRDITAESPYVPIPAAGSDLPISPYSCIEQTANDSAVTGLPADDVRPQETVIGETEGTKCDGYVPWSSTQASA